VEQLLYLISGVCHRQATLEQDVKLLVKICIDTERERRDPFATVLIVNKKLKLADMFSIL